MVTAEQKQIVQRWLAKAPFDDNQTQPENFSYESWFQEGRSLPKVVDVLMELLAETNLPTSPSGARRIVYALGWMNDKRAVPTLVRILSSNDASLRSEAVAAIGGLGDVGVSDRIRELLENDAEDENVRANACIAIGKLAPPYGEAVLERALKDRDQFVARAAAEGLRLLQLRKSK